MLEFQAKNPIFKINSAWNPTLEFNSSQEYIFQVQFKLKFAFHYQLVCSSGWWRILTSWTSVPSVTSVNHFGSFGTTVSVQDRATFPRLLLSSSRHPMAMRKLCASFWTVAVPTQRMRGRKKAGWGKSDFPSILAVRFTGFLHSVLWIIGVVFLFFLEMVPFNWGTKQNSWKWKVCAGACNSGRIWGIATKKDDTNNCM